MPAARPVAAAAIALAASVGLSPHRALAQASAPTAFVLNRFVPGDANGPGNVGVMRINPDGTSTLLYNEDVGHEPNAIAISPDGRLLAVAGGFTGTVDDEFVLFRVNPDSSLTRIFTAGVPDSAFEMIWLDDDLIAILETSTLGTNYIHVYRWLENIPFLLRTDVKSSGNFSTSLAYDPSRRYLYTQSSLGDSIIQRWAVDLTAGRLTLAETVFNFDFPLDLTITPDLRFLYVGGGAAVLGNTCDTCIDGYDITDPEQVIPLFNPFTSAFTAPSKLAASENGYLYVGHGSSSIIAAFDIATDGSLTDTGYYLDFDGAGSSGTIGGMASMGPWLFVADDSSALDGVTGLVSYTTNADGSLTQIGDTVYSGGLPVLFEAIELWPGTGEPVCPCEADGDLAQVNVFDLLAYLNLWFAHSPAAERTGDSPANVDVFDLLTFLDCWFNASAGNPCP